MTACATVVATPEVRGFGQGRLPYAICLDEPRSIKGAAAVAEAPAKDLEIQGTQGVNDRGCWAGTTKGVIDHPVEAPKAGASARVH